VRDFIWGKGSAWNSAFSLFHCIPTSAVTPDEITHNAVIRVGEKGGRWRHSLWLLQHMPFPQNTIAYCAAVSACEKGLQWAFASHLVNEMRSHALELDNIACNSLTSAFEKGQQWEHAFQFLDFMQQRDTRQDVISYRALISACGICQIWQSIMTLLTKMLELRLRPNQMTYSAAVSASRHWSWALDLVADTLRCRNEIDAITCNALISTCDEGHQWSQAVSLLSNMQCIQVPTTTVGYGAVISSCEKKVRIGI